MIAFYYIDYSIWYGSNFSFWIFCEDIFFSPHKNKREEYPLWSEIVYVVVCFIDCLERSLLFMVSVESEKVYGVHSERGERDRII